MNADELSGVWGIRAAMLLLAVLTLAVYGNSLHNGFVWDDEYIIVNDPAVRNLDSMATLLVSPDVVKPYYRPLCRASYLLDYRLFGMRPAGFHAVNVAIHLLNVLLIFGIGRRLFGRTAPAVLAAALFAVHPINTEAVDFLSTRNTVLSLFFVLAATLVFHEGLLRGSWTRLVLSGLLWFLGLLSKEPAAAAIALFALLAYAAPGRSERFQRRWIVTLTPHLVFAGIYTLLRMQALGGAVGAGGIAAGLAGRLVQNVFIIPRYAMMILFPSGLTIMHEPPAGDPASLAWIIPFWICGVLALVALLRSRSVPVRFGLFWIAINYVAIANIVPIPSTPIAERYLYLPAVGVWLIAADRWYALHARYGGRVMTAAAVAVVVLLGGATVFRNRDWKSDRTLFGSVIRTNPGSAEGHFNMGNTLRDAGDLAGAAGEWRETLRIAPAHAGAMTQLGSLAAVTGDLGTAERRFRAALASDPRNAIARFNLALVLEKTGRTEEALEQFDRFLQHVPVEYRDYIPRAEAHRDRLRTLVD